MCSPRLLKACPGIYIFQDADVALPILSTGKLADCDYELVYRKTGGEIRNLATGEVSKLFRMHGVYFIELSVDSKLLAPPPPPKPEGFVRQG